MHGNLGQSRHPGPSFRRQGKRILRHHPSHRPPPPSPHPLPTRLVSASATGQSNPGLPFTHPPRYDPSPKPHSCKKKRPSLHHPSTHSRRSPTPPALPRQAPAAPLENPPLYSPCPHTGHDSAAARPHPHPPWAAAAAAGMRLRAGRPRPSPPAARLPAPRRWGGRTGGGRPPTIRWTRAARAPAPCARGGGPSGSRTAGDGWPPGEERHLRGGCNAALAPARCVVPHHHLPTCGGIILRTPTMHMCTYSTCAWGEGSRGGGGDAGVEIPMESELPTDPTACRGARISVGSGEARRGMEPLPGQSGNVCHTNSQQTQQ